MSESPIFFCGYLLLMVRLGNLFCCLRRLLWPALSLVLFLLVFGQWYLDKRDGTFDSDRLLHLRDVALPETAPGKAGNSDWPQWRGLNRDGVSQETGLVTACPADGPRILWRAPSGLGYASLAVTGGRLFTVVQDEQDENEAALCLDANTGATLWKFSYPCVHILPDHGYGDGPRATPTIDGDRVYVLGAGGVFHCLNASNGALLWRHDLPTEFGEMPASQAYWGHCCSPLVEGRLVIVETRGRRGDIAAFDKRTGDLVWKALDDPAGYSSPIAVTLAGVRQLVFFSGAGLVGLSPDAGEVLWRYPWQTNDECNIATPVAADRYLFISSGYDRGCALLEVSLRSDGLWRAEPVYTHKRMR
jgi:outer membrane protein assembly factor BamB